MSWEILQTLAEIVGAVGVMASLIYLSTQVRDSTIGVRASTFQANTELWQEWLLAVADPDFATANRLGLAGDEQIDPIQFHQFFLICRAMFLNFENQYFQCRQGVLDRWTYAGYEPAMKQYVLAFPGIRAWWVLNRHGYGTEFARYIDRLIEETPVAELADVRRRWLGLTRRINRGPSTIAALR